MDMQYNVYYAGGLLPDHSPHDVRTNLQTLFKANEATLDKLFAGKPQLIKRACNKATALKYKRALENAGAKPLIKRLQENTTTKASSSHSAQNAQTAAKSTAGLTMAERIAALTADDSISERFSDSPPTAQVTEEPERPIDAPADAVAVATSQHERAMFTVAEPGEPMLATDHTDNSPPVATPDISHLSMGAAGELIPTLPRHDEICEPDISGISLAPQGSDFSDCVKTPTAVPDIDLSTMKLAPVGSEILEQPYRKTISPLNLDVSHLSVDQP